MKKRLQILVLSLLVGCPVIIAKSRTVNKSSITQKLTEMIEDQLDSLDSVIGFAKKSHDNFNREDEDYLAARNLSGSDALMKSEHVNNVEIKSIVDTSNMRAINTLLPLKKELTDLDFYKHLPQEQEPKSKKKELLEKNNARIDRYLCGATMIDEKIERLDEGIKTIQVLKINNRLSSEEVAASNALIEVKRKLRAELKKHKQDIQKAVRQLKKHRIDLE